jgi:Tfp pilus assembly protein PilX
MKNRSNREPMSVLRRQERSAESGIALVISLVTLLILTLIGFGLLGVERRLDAHRDRLQGSNQCF